MSENKDPMDSIYISSGHHFHTQQDSHLRTRRYLEPPKGVLALSALPPLDILTSHPVENYGSCRYRNPAYGRDSTYCEIVQKRAVALPHRQTDITSRHNSRDGHCRRRLRASYSCRKRLHKAHFRNRRYKHLAAYSESYEYRRRRHTTVAQRKAANVREQKRMMNLKEAFRSLRESLPTLSYERKLSRIDTLRLAIMYITFLKQLADGKQSEEIQWNEMKP